MMTLTFGFLGYGCTGDSPEELADYNRSLREEFPRIEVISTADLAIKEETPVLLDVRSEEEFAVSHLPGAIRADGSGAKQLDVMRVSKDREIVVYCSVGYRSARLAGELSAAGFSQVRNLEGSIFAWTNEGRPLVNAKGSTTETHPYSRKWGRFLEKSHWSWKP